MKLETIAKGTIIGMSAYLIYRIYSRESSRVEKPSEANMLCQKAKGNYEPTNEVSQLGVLVQTHPDTIFQDSDIYVKLIRDLYMEALD